MSIRVKLRHWVRNPLGAPSSGTASEWDDWENKARSEHPFLYWLLETAPFYLSFWWRRFVTEPIWWVKHRLIPRHRYHVVKTSLKPGYYDQDHRLMYAAMALLDDYLDEVGGIEELEKWTENVRGTLAEYEPGPADAQVRAQEAYARIWRWWHYWRPEREKLEAELLTYWHDDRHAGFTGRLWPDTPPTEAQTEKLDILNAHEIAALEEDKEMLILLMEHRGHLWQ